MLISSIIEPCYKKLNVHLKSMWACKVYYDINVLKACMIPDIKQKSHKKVI